MGDLLTIVVVVLVVATVLMGVAGWSSPAALRVRLLLSVAALTLALYSIWTMMGDHVEPDPVEVGGTP